VAIDEIWKETSIEVSCNRNCNSLIIKEFLYFVYLKFYNLIILKCPHHFLMPIDRLCPSEANEIWPAWYTSKVLTNSNKTDVNRILLRGKIDWPKDIQIVLLVLEMSRILCFCPVSLRFLTSIWQIDNYLITPQFFYANW